MKRGYWELIPGVELRGSVVELTEVIKATALMCDLHVLIVGELPG